MRYLSTRGGHATDLSGAVMQGLAPDGGLYVPEELPRVAADELQGESLVEIASEVLTPFFSGSWLAPALEDICRDALDFPVPLISLGDSPGALSVLELFHGPTAAFKDVGARFLAAVMERVLAREAAEAGRAVRPVTILVATSGDTGGAVAAAFHRREHVRIAVLFPRGHVSPRQEKQLTCWGDNVRAFEVDGSFDECQTLIKRAFTDPELSRRHRLSAANSINLGRLLPQVAYHAAACLWHRRVHGTVPGFIVPTGNLGNGLACIWAQAMGLPVREVVLAVNANRTIPDFLSTGQWQPRSSVPTLASAMDVGDPSNMERLWHLLPGLEELRRAVEAYPVDDDAILEQIVKDDQRYGRVWCPHTATGFWVYDHLPQARRRDPWIVVATAHPAKFDQIVEKAVGHTVEVPAALEALLARPTSSIRMPPDIATLGRQLDEWDSSSS